MFSNDFYPTAISKVKEFARQGFKGGFSVSSSEQRQYRLVGERGGVIASVDVLYTPGSAVVSGPYTTGSTFAKDQFLHEVPEVWISAHARARAELEPDRLTFRLCAFNLTVLSRTLWSWRSRPT